jgi:hypothetical protein
VQTGASSWAAVLVENEETAEARPAVQADATEKPRRRGEDSRLLMAASATGDAVTERIPRIAIAMVTFLIFAISLTAGIEYLSRMGSSLR